MVSYWGIKKIAVLLSILVFPSSGFYYYYVDTVTFAEIIGSSGNPTVDIFINLFDFDTGCTRHEINELSKKCQTWNRKMDRIMAIQDPVQRDRQHTELVAEMMRDPAFKKLTQKILGTGSRSMKSILETLSSARGIGLF